MIITPELQGAVGERLQLFHGDCHALLPTLPDRSVDLILCDPPYGTTLIAWDRLLDYKLLWAEYARLLRPGGCAVLFGSQPFSAALIMSNPRWFKYELIWDKNKCGSPGLAKIRPMKTHENILVFAPGRTIYNPHMEAGEPYRRKAKNAEGYVGRCNNHGYGLKARTEFENAGTRYPKSILRISRDFSAQQQVHPTQKPVPLLEWLIRTYSQEGATVLDHCLGAGSTMLAALRTGRRCIGIETEAQYIAITISRIQAELNSGLPLG